MATITLEYDARNSTVRRLVDGLLSSGLFRIKSEIEKERKIGIIYSNNGVVAVKKQQADLGNFLKGTISGDELVKYVCNKLDEKYNCKELSSNL